MKLFFFLLFLLAVLGVFFFMDADRREALVPDVVWNVLDAGESRSPASDTLGENVSFSDDEPLYFVQLAVKTVRERGARAVVEDLRAGGVNVIALQVFPDDDYNGIYWDSKIAPVREDILGEFVSLAHKEDIRVFVWMKTLDMPWVYENNPKMRLKSYDNGKIVEDLGWYRRVSPASDEHREYIVSIFREIVTDYDIDGILLQDDLYWGSDEVYDDYSKRAYFEDTGQMLTANVFDDPEFHRWKSRQITLIVKSVNDEVKSIDPDVKLVVNVYAGCATGESWCLPSFGQDYPELSRNSDYMTIMAYHVLGKKRPSWVADVARGAVSREAYGNEAIIKVQVVDWEGGNRNVDASDVREALVAAKRGGARNIGFFLSGRSMGEMELDFRDI